MQLEFHQLDRRWEHLRVRHPARQRRLLASLADSGQQTPIVVAAQKCGADRYVVIDGYKRIAALEQLGRGEDGGAVLGMADERGREQMCCWTTRCGLSRTLILIGGGLAAWPSWSSASATGSMIWQAGLIVAY